MSSHSNDNRGLCFICQQIVKLIVQKWNVEADYDSLNQKKIDSNTESRATFFLLILTFYDFFDFFASYSGVRKYDKSFIRFIS